MISALNLLWIVPLSGLFGILLLCLLGNDSNYERKDRGEDEQENIYREAKQKDLEERSKNTSDAGRKEQNSEEKR